MEISNLIPHIEALIFASDKPLTSVEITELLNSAFGFMEEKVEVEQVEASIEGIAEKYGSEFYPFEVKQSGGGWQFLTKKDFHKTVAQLNGEKFLKRLSAAALETLAIIAYKQPITKGEIESIRGVSSDYSVQKLLEKELIVISGRNEKLPGHPLVYNTSKSFMDYFGINTPEDLPRIKEVLADQIVEPTIINHTDFEETSSLIVTDDGELINKSGEIVPGSEEDAKDHVNGSEVGDFEIEESSIEEIVEVDESIEDEFEGEDDDEELDEEDEITFEGDSELDIEFESAVEDADFDDNGGAEDEEDVDEENEIESDDNIDSETITPEEDIDEEDVDEDDEVADDDSETDDEEKNNS